MGAFARPVVTFLSIIPPLAVLPILFIALGVDELAKIALIFLGTVFVFTRDTTLGVRALPGEQLTKALTLGASELDIVYRVVLPQILPRLLETVRLSLGAAWLFLIASEAIAATDGLGYRIFLARRYLSMDLIIPYVLWITFLGFALDFSLRRLLSWRFAWYEAQA
jgi:NitT/TauT family transport system permease protein